MKILIISRGMPTKKEPSWGIFEQEQARALILRGHTVVVASIDMRIRLYWRKIGISRMNDGGVINYNLYLPFPYPLLPTIFKRKFTQWLMIILYNRIVKEHEPFDVIHAHYLYNMVMAVALKRKYNLPIIGTEHWSKVNSDFLSRKLKIEGDFAYKKLDKLTAVSASLADRVYKNFSIKPDVINNMVDTSLFNFHDFKEKDFFNFISVGRLEYGKGFDVLIEAFAKANFQKEVYLTIVGAGNLRKKLEKQIFNLGLEKQIFLVGARNKAEIAQMMASSDSFILTSRHETFGVVYIEALASGLPIIATKCGGTGDFEDDSLGIFVPVDDIEAISSSLETMVKECNNYNRNYLANYCSKRFSADIILEKLEHIYSEVLNNQ
ncbi:N-acetyl-alpha-D-glucosaminyl L-malate synthase [anaerobic digester metagenome]